MSSLADTKKNTSNKKPQCPKCNGKSTLGYLNGRNGKVNYFCNKCFIEITFNNKGRAISFSEISADGSIIGVNIKINKNKK